MTFKHHLGIKANLCKQTKVNIKEPKKGNLTYHGTSLSALFFLDYFNGFVRFHSPRDRIQRMYSIELPPNKILQHFFKHRPLFSALQKTERPSHTLRVFSME